MGHGMLNVWRDMGVLKSIVNGCIDGTASETDILRRLRQRRGSRVFQKALLGHLEQKGRHALGARYYRMILARRPAPHFRRAMEGALKAMRMGR